MLFLAMEIVENYKQFIFSESNKNLQLLVDHGLLVLRTHGFICTVV